MRQHHPEPHWMVTLLGALHNGAVHDDLRERTAQLAARRVVWF
jgi:hypothetical protein